VRRPYPEKKLIAKKGKKPTSRKKKKTIFVNIFFNHEHTKRKKGTSRAHHVSPGREEDKDWVASFSFISGRKKKEGEDKKFASF